MSFRITKRVHRSSVGSVILWYHREDEKEEHLTTSAGCFSYAGISSTADVQGRALCPGSTPGAPLKYRLDREVVM